MRIRNPVSSFRRTTSAAAGPELWKTKSSIKYNADNKHCTFVTDVETICEEEIYSTFRNSETLFAICIASI